MTQTQRREVVKEYVLAYKEMPTYTLAKLVLKERGGELAISLHAIRAMITRMRGKNLCTCSDSYVVDRQPVKQPINYRPENVKTGAKILVLDIETAPIKAYVWNIWQQNVNPMNQIAQDWFVLTWAAKWLYEDVVFSGCLTSKEAIQGNDKRIVKGIWGLVNEADIVIAHNGDKFDMPKLNSRFILNDMPPPMPYQSIDTLKHIRRQFGFVSNKLDYVNKLLNLPRKSETGGMELWIKCLEGDKEALQKMLDYNVQDVRILEETYLAIRAWIKPHPNLGLFLLDESQHRCPSCGSDKLVDEGKPYYTTANRYELLRCGNCGSTGRKRLGSTTLKEKRHLLISSPK